MSYRTHARPFFSFFTLLILVTLVLCLGTLTACSNDGENVSRNDALAEDFLDHLIADDYDAAYAMVKTVVSPTDFKTYWATMRTAADGATTYDMDKHTWNRSVSKGIATVRTEYEVTFDNDCTIYLTISTQDGIPDIAGVGFHDLTAFNRTTGAYVPYADGALFIFSLASLAFAIWMLVDCSRRPIRKKGLWVLLILLNLTLTLTVGQLHSGIRFGFELLCAISGVKAAPALLALTVKLGIPVGALFYFFRRKHLTEKPTQGDVPVSPVVPSQASADTSTTPPHAPPCDSCDDTTAI